MSVLIETTLGDIVIDLYWKERPRCSLSFLKLCKTKYFNFCLFHSVQRDFVAQTGDPTGTGKGGQSIFPSKYFEAEEHPKIKHDQIGTVSMVNDGNGYHGSQFLFTLRQNLDSLDGIHTVFGFVAEGLDVLAEINNRHCDKDFRPYQNVRITHTLIIEDPFDDPPGLPEVQSPTRPSEEESVGHRIEADEVINPDEGLDAEELKKREQDIETQHNAQVLEIIGDLPDKDVKPPDNVLFVCKLNALTTSEDLEVIFSRFGKIESCEIITDFKTGASLQYAFIEFENSDMCEKAYHKMDNVLIDDRRIHVDFSQSVSQVQYPQFWKKMKGLASQNGGGDKRNSTKEESRMSRRDRSPAYRSRDQRGSKSHDHRNDSNSKRPKDRRYHEEEYDSSKRRKHKQQESEVRGGKHSKSSRHNSTEKVGASRKYRDEQPSSYQHHRPRSPHQNDDKSSKHHKSKKEKKRRHDPEMSPYEVRCGKSRRHDRKH